MPRPTLAPWLLATLAAGCIASPAPDDPDCECGETAEPHQDTDSDAPGDSDAPSDSGDSGDSGQDTGEPQGSLVTYPGPDGIDPSAYYTVSVEQNGAHEDSFVYQVDRQQATNASLTTSWTTFSFDGPVSVSVTRASGTDVQRCDVLPSSFEIEPQVSGDTCTFTLDRPRKVSVEFDRDTTHPMLVFADALETDVPDPDDADVVYYGAGVHDIGDTTLTSGQTVYLEGGAYVRGRFLVGSSAGLVDEQDITIRGRGVLSGENYPHGSTNDDHLINFWGAERTLIEGITLVQAPLYNVLIYGADSTVRNVKAISWWYSTDGIYVGLGGGLIEDCFLKVNDDAFKLYDSDTTVRDSVIWQLENGAPFQLSWNMPYDNHGFVVQNIDIIRMEHRADQINLAAVDALHGGAGHMSGYLFEDIRIENADWRLFYLTLQRNDFADPNGEMGQLSDLTFRNVSVTGALSQPSQIFGYSADHTVADVTFQNLKINGNLITSADEGDFLIDSGTTNDIRFEIGTFITDRFVNDDFLTGEDCEAHRNDTWGDPDSAVVHSEQLHLVNTLADPESECFTTAGWSPREPVTPPFTVEYTVDVADSDFGYGGYTRASLIWDLTNLYGLATDVSLVKETVDWHGQVEGFEDVVQQDQYTLYAQGLGTRMATIPSDGVETITIRQVIGESAQETYVAVDGSAFEHVHTYENYLGPSFEITPIVHGSDCGVWNHNDFDLAIDRVGVYSEDPAPCD